MTRGRRPQLVYLYGPPAVGKLTVAERLAELTGYRLFHNHLTVNALKAVFDFGTEAFGAAIHRLRLDVFADAAHDGLDVIFTNNSEWGGQEGRRQFASFTSQVAARVGQNGGEVRFVQLTAPDEVLLDRVSSDSRRSHSKLVDAGRLREMLAVHERAPLHGDDLVLDTSVLTPDAAARAVVAWLGSPGSVPDRTAATDRRPELATAAWLNGLATMQVAAGCVIRDRQGRVLLVKPTYKPRWEIPGGAVEEGESPLEACTREVFEELGIEVMPSRLLSVDHQPMSGGRRGALRFVFDGGVVHDEQLAAICMQPSELSAWKMVGLAELDELLNPTVATRVRVGLEQPGTYLEDGAPVAHLSDMAPPRPDDR